MSRKPHAEIPLEPERYELSAAPLYHFEVDRREFFKFLGAGVLVFSILKRAALAQESGGARRSRGEDIPKEIDAWLHIGENGKVTVYTGKVEVGQNIRTSLSQAVAEELHVAIDQIEMVMGDTQLTPFDMGTFGSRTTPTMNPQLRKVAAAARELLIGLAATQWQADRGRLIAADGKVTDPQGKQSVEYAALLKGQQLVHGLPAEAPLIPAANWRVAGQSVRKVDGRDFVTGKHRYPSDQNLPGMLHGKILRPPAFDAKLVSLDTQKAEQMGVTVVHDGNFIGVAAPSAELAASAIAVLQSEWKSEPQPSSRELFDYLRKNQEKEDDPTGDGDRFETGSVDQALQSADHKLQQTYTVSYIAHVPLEPRAALAQWDGDRLTVWTGTQRPFGVRGQLAEAFRMPEERIRVLMPDTGSGYGGKHTGETAIEAARLARAAKRPVKVVWTREEEFAWAYFRPAGVIDVSSGVRGDGTITAWEFHNYNSGSAGIRTYYEIPNQRIAFHSTKSPLRQGSYRALAATANHFARESHMDELAHALKMDSLEFRLKNLKNERLRAVFQAAAKQLGWGKPKVVPGQGFGMGGGYEKLGNIATFAEVRVDQKSGEVRVVRVVSAFECGAVVNPDNLRNQIEGSNVQGLGGALFEAIEFDNGKILNGRMSQYRVPRFSDTPVLETVLLDRKDLPSSGAGECPMIGLAPAVANAIFDATGVRLRSLPLAPNALKAREDIPRRKRRAIRTLAVAVFSCRYTQDFKLMANILYGVNGEGAGHSTRAKEVLKHLVAQGHTVHVASFDRGLRNLSEQFDVTEICGFRFAYVNNRVRYKRTIAKNLITVPQAARSLSRLKDLVEEWKTDLVITDFEPLTCHVGHRKGLPVISIDNQHCLTNAVVSYPGKYRRDAAAAKLVTRMMTPHADAYLVISFFTAPVKKRNTFLFPPLLRQEILDARPTQGEHVLVYVTSPAPALAKLLSSVRGRFVAYGFGREGEAGNIVYKQPSQDGFFADLTSAKAIIANSGFSLVTEALHLGKPYLAVPVLHQFEQIFNAYWLDKAGYGAYWEDLNKECVESFLYNLTHYREKLAGYPRQGNAALLEKLDTLIAAGG